MAIKVSGVEVIDDSRNITTNVGTIDGRDIAADGAKLDGIEAGADVTDATNVEAAGAVMDADIGVTVQAYSSVLAGTTASFTTADETKLDGIEAGADVTDAGNVEPLVDAHLNTSGATTGQYLGWNGSDYAWSTVSGYTNSDVDTHLNTGTASSGEVLSWTGSDYDWVSGGATDIDGLSDAFSTGNSIGFGLYAGATSTGVNNIFVGPAAGRYVGAGFRNVAIGSSALQTLSFGTVNPSYNVAVGYQSLAFISTGDYNTAIGASTGYDLSTGGYNFLGGYNAGANITSGSNNVAIGNGALDAATTGGRNIAIGQDAIGLGVATTADGDNVAIGYTAAYDLTTGARNVAIGKGALNSVTTASEVVAIGWNAGNSCATGNESIFIGSEAGQGITNAGVIVIGGGAKRGGNAGYQSITIGASANGTNVPGNYSVTLGPQAGSGTGDDNINIGYASSGSSGNNCITIGRTAAPSSGTASNEITLGNSSITRFRIPGAGIDNTSDALSGTTPSVNVGARDTYTLTTSGNTTFTFTGAPSSGQVGTFSLIITAGGTHTLTWPASVDWAGGTAPDAPASGEKDIYTFMTIDAGTTWYGFLAGDAMA